MKFIKCTNDEASELKIEKGLKLSWEMSPKPFKVEIKGEIVALISISQGGEYGPDSIEIDCFEVFEKGEGTGSKIITEVLNTFKKQTISLYPDNKRCMNFWLKHGFKIEHEGEGVIRLVYS